MTAPVVALCADEESLRHPEAIGLPGEDLAAQSWLRLFSTAEETRAFLKDDVGIREVWVASCDDVAPINLAATLKRDRADRYVGILSFQETGSFKSRVSAGGIDAFLTRKSFVARYVSWKHRSARAQGSAAASAQPSLAVRPGLQAASTRAFLLPVVSGSGGAGKSTVAALAALLGKRMGYNTLLLDFDLQFGDMPELLGCESPLRIDDAMAVPARLAHLRSDDRMPALLAAPARLERSEEVAERAGAFLDCLLGRFDLVVANTGAAWAEQHAVLLERSSRALFLVDQRPSSLRACHHALDLCARCGIATTPFLFAVNRCAKGAPFTSLDVSCALRGSPVFELKDGGRDVEELLGAGLPFELLGSRNDLCQSLERLLSDVLPNAEAVRAARGSALVPSQDGRGWGLSRSRKRRPRKRKTGGA